MEIPREPSPTPVSRPARLRRGDPLEPPAPDVDWATFRDLFEREFLQGQHVTILGPTQSGKTTVALEVLQVRLRRAGHVLFLATKREDPLISALATQGWRVSDTLDIRSRDGHVVEADRAFVFWPVRTEIGRTGRRLDMTEFNDYQRHEVRRALNYVWHARRWTVYADETIWLADDLGLKDELETLWFQGSSAKIGLVASAQRPAWVPRGAYSSPEHLFFFRTTDKDDLDRLADIGAGIDRPSLVRDVTGLRRHEFLYVQPRSQPPLRIRSMVQVRT